jgi:hypothetical protein
MNRYQKFILGILAIFKLDVWFAVKFFKWQVDYGVFNHDEVHFHVGRNHWVVRRSDYTSRRPEYRRVPLPMPNYFHVKDLLNEIANAEAKCPEFDEHLERFDLKNYIIERRKLHYIARDNG